MNKPLSINKQIVNNISSEEYINRIKLIYQKDNNNILNLKRKSVVISNYFLAESIKEGEQFGEMMTDQFSLMMIIKELKQLFLIMILI